MIERQQRHLMRKGCTPPSGVCSPWRLPPLSGGGVGFGPDRCGTLCQDHQTGVIAPSPGRGWGRLPSAAPAGPPDLLLLYRLYGTGQGAACDQAPRSRPLNH